MGAHNQGKQHGFASVKPRDAEVVNGRINKKKVLTVILSLVVVALLVWGGSYFFKNDIDSKVTGGIVDLFKKDDTAATSTESTDNQDSESGVAKPEITVNGSYVNHQGSFVATQGVKLALVANPDLFDYKNTPRVGCDALIYSDARVAVMPKVLNSTLIMLFNDTFNYGFLPANFIASTQKDLKFDHAVIEGGVAKVFLKGEMTISDKNCDSGRVVNQITYTAKQFPTVNSVEIYLNGNKI